MDKAHKRTPSLEGPSDDLKAKSLKIKNTFLKANPITDLPYNPNLKLRARKLRQAENLSEVLFWMQVTKGQFIK